MRVYVYLAVSLVACKLLLLFASIDYKNEGQRVMLQWPGLTGIILYGAIGVWLLMRSRFASMETTRRGAAIAVAHGLAIGSATSLIDALHPQANLHHPLPEALPLYWYGAVFSEIWYHLVPLSIVMFLFARKGERQERLFWIALIVLSAWEGRRFFTDRAQWTAFGAALTAVTYLANASEIWLFRRHGFMAAVTQRMASYSIWHILWPLLRP